MSEQHGSSRKTLMFNTAAFIFSSIWFVISLFWGITASGFGFSTILYLLMYIGLGLVPFFGAWKAFGQMNYSKARNRGYLSWIWIVIVTLIKLIF